MGPRLREDDFESVVTAFDSIRRFRDTFTSSHAESVALIRAETPAAPHNRSRCYAQERAPKFFGTTSHPRHTFEINALPVCAI
jgi:hypothetical protein